MWKVIVLVAAITLVFSGSSIAADLAPVKAAPEARQKQMEELGAIRGRIVFKLEELRRMLSTTALQARSTAITDAYTKTKAVVLGKASMENGKAMKDQATIDALTLKSQNMDAALSKIQGAWQVYQYAINDQAEVVSYLNSLLQLCTLDDYWNRSDMDVQLLVNVATAVEAKADVTKAKLADATKLVTGVFDEAEPMMKQ